MLLFFLVSYALTWWGIVANWIVPSDYWPQPMFPLGPLIAAPVVIWLTEGRGALRAWWRRILCFRAPASVYAAATIIPAAIIGASVVLALAAGAEAPTREELAGWPVLLTFPILVLAGPLPEEPAFRGYSQHALQQTTSPPAARLWIGLGVLVWHMPVLVSGMIPWPIAIALPAVSVVYAWLYRAGGSVWPLVALHLTQNTVGGEYVGPMFTERENVIVIGFLAGFYVVWAVLLVWWLGPGLRRAFDAAEESAAAELA